MNDYDVIVVGSGAGGSVLAYRLARAGLRVLVLEKGRRQHPQSFSHNELEMIQRVYKKGGLQTTVDSDIAIVQGVGVGGSTVINNAIWLRPDLGRLLADWQAHGAHVDRPRLEHAYADLERALKVEPVPTNIMSHGTDVFRRGAQQLGLQAVDLSHNRTDCLGCGFCNFGCRYDRKASMLVTFIPWAEARGAQVVDLAEDVRIEHCADRARGVTYQRAGQSFRVSADAVVVACGAIGSSELLLRSGVKSRARIGAGFHLLGGVLVTAETPEPVNAYSGVGLTTMLGGRAEYVMETFFAPPAAFAVSLNGFQGTHTARMQRYAHLSQAGVMVGTDPTGEIRVKGDQTEIRLKLSERDLARLRAGITELCRIYLRGGATAVYPSLYLDAEIRQEADLALIEQRVRKPDDLVLGSAHPQGGNPMSEDPRRGVVGNDFRVHGYRNLFVSDASVFPTNLWANCQATTMAMAYLAADFVLGRA